jgi:predicted metal-binding membrane protein
MHMHILPIFVIGFCVCFVIARLLENRVRRMGKRTDFESYQRARSRVFLVALGTLLTLLRTTVLWAATSTSFKITGLDGAVLLYIPESIFIMLIQHMKIPEALFYAICFSVVASFTFAFSAVVAALTKSWRSR